MHDYIDVDDVVEGILNLSYLGIKGIYELGSGKSHSNQEVLEIVEKVTGKKANINKVDTLRSYDTKDWKSTNLKARGYGWLPKKSLEQSIREMVKAYEN
jgi:nucleoside-diphosphate-sugar epimerase